MEGWIKSYRSVMDNPIVCKDADHYAVWGYLLHNATHTPADSFFGGKRITLQPGQLITGRKKIAEKFGINEHKVDRILKLFKIEQQIEQQTSNTSRLISVLNWGIYQTCEQQIEQQVSNKCATTEQQVSTIQECKNNKNERNNITPISPLGVDGECRFKKPTAPEVAEYCIRRNNGISEREFIDHYESNGWMVGRNKMKDWKAAIRTWENKRRAENKNQIEKTVFS